MRLFRKRSRPAAVPAVGETPAAKKKKVSAAAGKEKEEKKRRKEKLVKILKKLRRRRLRKLKLKREARPVEMEMKMKMKMKIRKEKKKKVVMADIWIPPKGFTRAEYELCQPFMCRAQFEAEVSWYPEARETLKLYYEQIQKTKGYGITVCHPRRSTTFYSVFYPLGKDMQADSRVKGFMPYMIDDLLEQMQEELELEINPAEMQVTNVVSIPYNKYLVSFSLKPHMFRDEVEVDAVEAMFQMGPFDDLGFSIVEWKLKKGSKLVYSTTSTDRAMEDYTKLMLEYSSLLSPDYICVMEWEKQVSSV